MNSLIHCIYASTASPEFQAQQLPQILKDARYTNRSMDITGMLLFAEGSFFQVLEGPAAAVDALMAKIATDPRHRSVTIIIRENIARRSFPRWTMGYAGLTPDEIQHLSGSNDFFQTGQCFSLLDPGRAKRLLSAFRDGRWRTGAVA